jgi:hypothetical protein
MVDIEPAMTAQCQAAAEGSGLAERIRAVHGDITSWQPPNPADRVVVARGGLQMLPTQQAVTQALTVSTANLATGGQLYLDVAMPWTAAPDTAHHLAPFLRFTGSTRLEGSNIIDDGQRRIQRSYTSILLPDRVAVRFRYHSENGPCRRLGRLRNRCVLAKDRPSQHAHHAPAEQPGRHQDARRLHRNPVRHRISRFICIATAR